MFIISYIYQNSIIKEKKRKLQLQLLESFVCYRIIDLVEKYVYYVSQSYTFEDIYQNLLYSYNFTFIRNLFFYLCIHLVYLFIYFIYYFIYLINYILYRKKQSKIREKSREKIRREYDQISQIIKKKCYL